MPLLRVGGDDDDGGGNDGIIDGDDDDAAPAAPPLLPLRPLTCCAEDDRGAAAAPASFAVDEVTAVFMGTPPRVPPGERESPARPAKGSRAGIFDSLFFFFGPLSDFFFCE